jgi:mercuric ion binding protein
VYGPLLLLPRPFYCECQMKTLMKPACQTLAALACVALMAAGARAEVKVTLSGVHLCCEGCTKTAEKAVAKLPEVKCVANSEDRTITITADKLESAQKAVNLIAEAGFHGKLDNKELKYKVVKLPAEKVERLEVVGVHQCCPACTKAIKTALGKVKGVKGDNAKPKAKSIVIEGEFLAKDVFAALEKAGFHASLPKKEKDGEKKEAAEKEEAPAEKQ